jgi:release factor glutamine methyltransferase
MKVSEALKATAVRLARAGMEHPLLEAELLLSHTLGRERWWSHVHPDVILTNDALKTLNEQVSRRARCEPLAYITGEKEFWSLPFALTKDTLIPRPETERIVETGLAVIRSEGLVRPRILDLGTGSGILAVSLAAEVTNAVVVATDRSYAALVVALENARRNGVEKRIRFVQTDWLEGFGTSDKTAGHLEDPSGVLGFDLVVSNPPYIPEKERTALSRDITDYEPEAALFGGEDGLDAIRRLVADVPGVLRNGGWFICEIGWDQGKAVSELVHAQGRYRNVSILRDLAGKDRVLQAQAR